MDHHDNAVATALSTALYKDGQQTPTANIPLGGYKITNLGDATARTDAAKTSQVQDGSFISGATGGSADTYTFTPSPAIAAYANGQCFRLRATATNTGASTLNVSGLGAKDIKTKDGSDLSAGMIVNTEWFVVIYDGTDDDFYIATVSNKDWDGDALAVANGGTGATSASSARSNLSAAVTGANGDITSLTACTALSAVQTLTGGDSGGVTVKATHASGDLILGWANSDRITFTGNDLDPGSPGGINLGTATNYINGLNVDTIAFRGTYSDPGDDPTSTAEDGWINVTVGGVTVGIPYWIGTL